MLKYILTLFAAMLLTVQADGFLGYRNLSYNTKEVYKKNGDYASTQEVKKALASKDWLVVDVRTKEEWSGARIMGSVRIGRQSPETKLGKLVLDNEDNLIKENLIVVCNSAARASLEAETFKKMGFKKVKIYDLYSWIDECNPVTTKYTVKKDKKGTGLRFGMFCAEHCKR
jgi:rhodanese-related sulfurtransferase